jgi:hypothetical protein
MKEAITVEGRWWIFGMENDPHYGTLTFSPEQGLELSVKIAKARTLAEVMSTSPEVAVSNNAIYGADSDDHPVTLFGCNPPGSSSSLGLLTLNYHPLCALLGSTAKSWHEPNFDHIKANFTLLTNWLNRSHVSIGHASKPFSVDVADLDPIEIVLSEDVKCTLRPAITYQDHYRGMELEQSHQVEFQFREPQPLWRMMTEYVLVFRRMLTLFTGTPIFTERIHFDERKAETTDTVTFLQPSSGISEAKRDLPHFNMRLSFADIRDQLPSVVRNWYRLHEQFKDALNLYFATVFNKGLYDNQQFLFLAQALEVYHRGNTNFTGYAQSKEEFKARKRRILEAVPDERDWLIEKLAHANEKTLAERLTDLLDARRDAVSRFINDPHIWAQTVRNTRNHFTHYSTAEKKLERVAKGSDLIRLIKEMEALLEICIFSDLGVSNSPIDRVINRLRRFHCFSLDDPPNER